MTGPTTFSPTTQAVLDAFRSSHSGPRCLAAALRAVADHIDHDWSAFNCIDALCEIAAELDGPSYTSKSQEQRKRFLDFIEKATP